MNVTLSNLAQLLLHAACCAAVAQQLESQQVLGVLPLLCLLTINSLYAGLRNGVQIGGESHQR